MQTRHLYLAVFLGVAAGVVGIPSGSESPDRSTSPVMAPYQDLPFAPLFVARPAPAVAVTPAALSPEVAPAPSPVRPVLPRAAVRPVIATRVAGPATVRTPGIDTRTPEQRGAEALALVDYPWTATGYRIAFSGPRPDLLGFTRGDNRLIEIFVRVEQSIPEIARVIAHEVGHAVDFSMTTEAERTAYRRIRGLDSRPWLAPCSVCSDAASPSGDWAETFAYWVLGPGRFGSELAPAPDAAQLEALGPLFAPSPPAGTPVAGPTPATGTTGTPPTSPASPTPAPAPPEPVAPTPGRPPGLLDRLLGS